MIEVSVEMSGTANIKLDESDLKQIAKNYNGDYNAYIKDIDIDKSSVHLEIDYYNYNKKEIESVLADYRKDNCLLEDFSVPYRVAKKRFLESCKIDKDQYGQLESSFRNIALSRNKGLKALAKCADYNNPKLELNYIYFDEDFIVSTDKRRLFIAQNRTSLKDVYIPKAFLDFYIENKDAEFELYENHLILKLNDHLFCCEKKHNFVYPDYRRIIPTHTKHKVLYKNYLRDQRTLDDGNRKVSFFTYRDDYIGLNDKFLMRNYKFETVSFNQNNLPIMFENSESKYIVMPLIFDEDEIRDLTSKGL